MEKGALATGLACEWVGVGGGGLWGVARCGLGAALTSVCRSSSLDWKKDRNRTEPNYKTLDHLLQLHKF